MEWPDDDKDCGRDHGGFLYMLDKSAFEHKEINDRCDSHKHKK